MKDIANDTIESLYQITRRGQLTDQDMRDADTVYDNYLLAMKEGKVDGTNTRGDGI